jgi:hypothetical protein
MLGRDTVLMWLTPVAFVVVRVPQDGSTSPGHLTGMSSGRRVR